MEDKILDILKKYVGAILSKSILAAGIAQSAVDIRNLGEADARYLLEKLEVGVRIFIHETTLQEECIQSLRQLLGGGGLDGRPQRVAWPRIESVTVEIGSESDIVRARSHLSTLCEKQGISVMVVNKIATVIAEVSRNILQYAGRGRLEIKVSHDTPRKVEIIASDNGPGIKNLEEILSGKYKSPRGMGLGLRGIKNLMDDVRIESRIGVGTTVTASQYLK
jgi:serine/threonine-protein kinase RsbT